MATILILTPSDETQNQQFDEYIKYFREKVNKIKKKKFIFIKNDNNNNNKQTKKEQSRCYSLR